MLIAGSAGWGNYRHQADVSHVSRAAEGSACAHCGPPILALATAATRCCDAHTKRLPTHNPTQSYQVLRRGGVDPDKIITFM